MITIANLKASHFILGDLEHPNKLPFNGILTWFDAPSDNAPHGTGGRKVVIPASVGVPALSSLVGMAVNLVPGAMDDHSPQDKIGVITEAYAGDPDSDAAVPVYINGYIYSHDFEDAAVTIKLNQSALGFSYETAETTLKNGEWNGENVAIVTDIGYFTGASILLKDKAAYTNTSLAASKEDKEDELPMDGIKEILEAISSLKEYVDTKFEHFKKEDDLEDAVADSIDDASDAIQASEDKGEEKAEEAPVIEEEKKDEAVVEEDKKDEVVEDVKAVEEDAKDEKPAEETVAVQASADLIAQVQELQAQLAELKASADIQASARKSVAYPTTLASKYDVEPQNDFTKLMASIDSREDLSIEERLALKFEARTKAQKAK